MAYGTVNADVIQSSVSGVSLGAGNATNFKNRIINGAMMIDQRNAGASVSIQTNTSYTLDRWTTSAAVNSKYSVQQNAGSVTPPAGFINYLGVTSSAATTPSSTDSYDIRQKIEGLNISDLAWGTVNAKTVTLSFWVYSSLTGTFGGCLGNSAFNRSYPFTYTISSANTWTQISITIAGDTTGTWLTTNGVGIIIYFGLGVGSSLSGAAGAWSASGYTSATGATSVVGTNGATWYITGVQLEVGSSATGFEYRDYGRELYLCQRYYQITNTGVGMWTSSTACQVHLSQFVQMRTNPSVSQTSVLTVTDFLSVDSTQSSTGVTILTSNSSTGTAINVPNLSGGTSGRTGAIRPYSSTGAVTLSAEL